MLTREEVSEFKKLVSEIYNVILTDEEALDQGSRLIQLFELILRNKGIVRGDHKVVKHNG